MGNAIEKLGFLDFFNHIIVGLFIILGLFCISIQFGCNISNNVLAFLLTTAEVNTLLLVLCIVSIIAVAYILGLLCHEVFSTLDNHKTADRIIANLFEEKDSCIDNKKKRKRYEELAKKIFDDNGIEYQKKSNKDSGIEWNDELNNYFYAYCLYQVQIRGLNGKPEKLRDIEGLAESFCISSVFLLAILLIIGHFFWNTRAIPDLAFVIEAFMCPVFGAIFYVYRKRVLENRIRMILSLYNGRPHSTIGGSSG